MIEKRTVLILGAGASVECGFPVGYQLYENICQNRGMATIPINPRLSRLNPIAQSDVNNFRLQLSQSGRQSVDAFLETRGDLLDIGKRAIACGLIPFENEVRLFENPDGRAWYPYLYRQMGTQLDEFRINRLSVLTFNYDRSFEHFFTVALSRCYQVSLSEAWAHVQKIQIVHLYGSLGRYSPDAKDGRRYSSDADFESVNECVEALKILSEGAIDSPTFKQAHHLLQQAERVVILGFGFLPSNLERLNLSVVPPSTPILASAFGMTRLEQKAVNRAVGRDLTFGSPDHSILQFLREMVSFR